MAHTAHGAHAPESIAVTPPTVPHPIANDASSRELPGPRKEVPMDLAALEAIPAALTAIREFHRLKTLDEASLTPRDARLLATLHDLFEPQVEPRGSAPRPDRARLMISTRRPVTLRARGRASRAQLVGLTLRVIHVAAETDLAPGEWVRVGIPRLPDRRWHRFHGRVLRMGGPERLVTIALAAPAGRAPADRTERRQALVLE